MAIAVSRVADLRNMPFLKRGMRVEVAGKMGTITSGNQACNINVRLDGEKRKGSCHPTYETRYFDKEGNVIADYREVPKCTASDPSR